jgi:hypothetical protein
LTDHLGKATPSLSPNPIDGSPEKHLISQAISVIRILFCLALAGCSQGDEPTGNHPPGKPDIPKQPSIAVSGSRAIFLGTVNPSGLDTKCYFEFGLTTAYGGQLPSRPIGNGYDSVTVCDTVQNLALDTTYHCRLVAENSAGISESPDQTFRLPADADTVEFVFPLDAGTTWHYAYSRSFAHIPTHTETRGQEVWRSAGPVSPNAIRILVSRIDTTTTYPTYVGGDTTTVIAKLDTSFSIMVTADSLFIQWYQLAFRGNEFWMPGLFKIPRFVGQGKDTLPLGYGESKATYVSGKGLTFWKNYNGTMFYWDERLILESMSP